MASNSSDTRDLADYIGGKEATRILGVHVRTLYNWDAQGKIEVIRLPSGKRLYNVKKYLASLKQEEYVPSTSISPGSSSGTSGQRLDVAYIRVSSIAQKPDLERQRTYMAQIFPHHQIIEDIGSGMNLNRRGLRTIIHHAIGGRINEIVVAYKDRLARFGFELINDLVTTYSHGKIIVIHADKDRDPQEELIMDTLQIMNIFVAKMNGMRRYKAATE